MHKTTVAPQARTNAPNSRYGQRNSGSCRPRTRVFNVCGFALYSAFIVSLSRRQRCGVRPAEKDRWKHVGISSRGSVLTGNAWKHLHGSTTGRWREPIRLQRQRRGQKTERPVVFARLTGEAVGLGSRCGGKTIRLISEFPSLLTIIELNPQAFVNNCSCPR